MNEGRASLHTWSLTMAVLSLVAMGVWLFAPTLLSPMGMTVAHAILTLGGFGYLFVHIGGYRRWADCVTGVRGLLVIVLFASHALDPRAAWWKVGVAILIIVLDGVDGALARRYGPTERGAVFDMESDAFFLITMCAVAHLYLGVSAWVYVIGGLRPLSVCIWAVLRLFIEPPSPNRKGSQRGRLIHLALVIALIVDLAPLFPLGVKHAFTAVAVVLICYSYLAETLSSFQTPSPS